MICDYAWLIFHVFTNYIILSGGGDQNSVNLIVWNWEFYLNKNNKMFSPQPKPLYLIILFLALIRGTTIILLSIDIVLY